MKILAIRGKNLASLSSEFVVDFASEPLASAGLFAITGPTGAGKSTLLDALCLALYENTPRLGRAGARGESIPDVGDNAVSPSDPRTIMRRGSAEAFAEVDFLGSDGVGYRSRWSVRRANGKASGKLQASAVTLQRLDDAQALGAHTKTETLALIERAIGLSFEQFTRAVLLAQNDFATFLKASDNERAELLQTLTGSGTFSDISKQAFARMKAEKEALERLQLQLADQAPLAAGLRAEKEAAAKAHGDALQLLERQQREIEAQLHWVQQHGQLRDAAARAGKDVDDAKRAHDAAAARRRQLARIERVQDARPLFAESERLAREIAAAEKLVAVQHEELTQAQQQATAANDAAVTTAQQLVAAEAAQTAAQPQIDKAREVDTRIAALDPQHRAALAAHDAAGRRHAEAQAKLAAARKLCQENDAGVAAAASWLSANTRLRELAAGWQRWQALFEQAGRLNGERQTLAGEIGELDTSARRSAATLADARAAVARLADARTLAEQDFSAAVQAAAAIGGDDSGARRQASETRREQLLAAAGVWSRLGAAQQRQRQLATQRQQLAALVAGSAATRKELREQQPLAEREHAAAQRALDLARLAASANAESMRALLVADAPCPVCGASEHPYAGHAPAAAAMLDALAANVATAAAALATLTRRFATAESEGASAQKQLLAVDGELVELAGGVDELQRAWRANALAGELSALADEKRDDWFAQEQAAVAAHLQQIAGDEAKRRAVQQRREAAQAALAQASSALAAAQQNLIRSEAAQHAAIETQAAKRRRDGEAASQLAALLDQLDAVVAAAIPAADWRGQWQAQAADFVAACAAAVDCWLSWQKRHDDLAGRSDGLRVALAASEEASRNAASQLQIEAAKLAHCAADLRALHDERRALFAGRALAEVAAAFTLAVDVAKQKHTDATANAHKAGAARVRAHEAARQADAALAGNRRAHAAADARGDEWLRQFNAAAGDDEIVSPERLRELLALDGAQIASERESLQQLDRALASSAAVHAACRENLLKHESARPTDAGEDALKEALAKTRADLAAAGEAQAQARLELAGDDQRRQKSQLLRAQIDAQGQRERVWAQLGELIGSADGKKFRNFAQQLTLDVLLGYANRHLESLSRRYRLERIKDSLGLLVVDQDMGDELRSVHSLSGGESFLVSLALALGLASLSSHRVRVESLFIDEGFGSLDSESLRVAMEALDNLQAQGRKVGVISHVQEMTERIGTRVQLRRLAGGLSRVVVAA